ncbi:MAG: type II toxin-antitoxin system HicA family toxin [Bacteroidales bacterium]|nr:type II toxin-antitoxin system HicA family toxin [Bacteroidales bacterium]
MLRILKKDGWYEIKQSGSHIIMRHSSKKTRFLFLIIRVKR